MGANKTTNFRKCGDILINLKTMKKKTKVYTFHCGFCNADCDQLKKFSKHLEEQHLNIFEDEFGDIGVSSKTPAVLYEPEEIKVEVENSDSENRTNLNANKSFDDFLDPLITIKSEVDVLPNEYKLEDDREQIVNCAHDLEINEREKNFDIENNEDIGETLPIMESFSEEYSDDSKDCDFDKKRNASSQPCTKISKKVLIDDEQNESNTTNKLKRRRRPLYENILPFLIEQYQKYEILWQVDNIAFGVINKKYEVYGKIAEEIKLDHNENISLEDINYHINYINQLYSKDKEQEIKCSLEKKNFVPESELYTKMSFLKQSQGPYLCPICNEILPRYDPYCQHMSEHNGTPPFKCPSCSLTFNKYNKYLIHKKRHLGILNFHCDVCGKGYLFKNDLEWHVTSHTGDKPFLCPVCGRGFRARHGYDNHIRRHEERFRYECHICKRGFNFLYALNTHIKSHLNIRDVICKICGKGFTDIKYLRRHELIHGDVKGYKCNICGKAFFQACGLRAHRKNHHS